MVPSCPGWTVADLVRHADAGRPLVGADRGAGLMKPAWSEDCSHLMTSSRRVPRDGGVIRRCSRRHGPRGAVLDVDRRTTPAVQRFQVRKRPCTAGTRRSAAGAPGPIEADGAADSLELVVELCRRSRPGAGGVRGPRHGCPARAHELGGSERPLAGRLVGTRAICCSRSGRASVTTAREGDAPAIQSPSPLASLRPSRRRTRADGAVPSWVRRWRRARGRGLLRSPHPGEPVAQGEAGGDPPDRRRAAAPLPRLGRRGRPPGPVAAQRDRRRRRRREPTVSSATFSTRWSGSSTTRRTSRCSTSRPPGWSRSRCPGPDRARRPSTTRVSHGSTRWCSRRWPRSSSGSPTRASAS